MNSADRELTQKIRRAIEGDPDLSSYAHDIIIARDGKVTLRGPVKTDDEKNQLGEKSD